ncbi:MAG: Adenylosuccinate synthetase, partial [Desulfofundulus kuznetsovii]
GLKTVKICSSYRYKGETLKNFPASLKVLSECEPVYEEMPGWQDDISNVRNYGDLPAEARSYLERLASLSGVPIVIVGVGMQREQTIIIHDVMPAC